MEFHKNTHDDVHQCLKHLEHMKLELDFIYSDDVNHVDYVILVSGEMCLEILKEISEYLPKLNINYYCKQTAPDGFLDSCEISYYELNKGGNQFVPNCESNVILKHNDYKFVVRVDRNRARVKNIRDAASLLFSRINSVKNA